MNARPEPIAKPMLDPAATNDPMCFTPASVLHPEQAGTLP